MKSIQVGIILLCALLLPTIASAASADMYLKIEGVDGESHVVRCESGACATTQLAPGTYSVLACDAGGKVIPSNLTLQYAVVSPRDSSSGQATGKRMHRPITITKELGRGVVPGNTITVEASGAQLAIGVSDAAVEVAQAKITKSRSNIQNN